MLCFKKSYNSFGQQSSTRQLGKDKTNSFHFNFIAFCDFMLSWYLHLLLWRRVGETCKTIFIEGEQRSFRESFSIRCYINAALSLLSYLSTLQSKWSQPFPKYLFWIILAFEWHTQICHVPYLGWGGTDVSYSYSYFTGSSPTIFLVLYFVYIYIC